MMKMKMNCFYGMVDWRKALSLTSSRDNFQRSSPSRILYTPQAGFEPTQNLSLAFVKMKLQSSDNHHKRRHILLVSLIVECFKFALIEISYQAFGSCYENRNTGKYQAIVFHNRQCVMFTYISQYIIHNILR